MYLTKEIKKISSKNTVKGKTIPSAEGQIALFTHRINHLTEYLKKIEKTNTERWLKW